MFALCLPMFAYFVCFVVIITQGLNNIGFVLRTTPGGSGIPPRTDSWWNWNHTSIRSVIGIKTRRIQPLWPNWIRRIPSKDKIWGLCVFHSPKNYSPDNSLKLLYNSLFWLFWLFHTASPSWGIILLRWGSLVILPFLCIQKWIK